MRLPHLLCCLLLVEVASAQDSSNTVYRLRVDNRARRSIHDLTVYRIPKGTTEFILDFSKVLESPFFKPDPPVTNSGIRSAVITLPDDRMYDADVKEGWNSVRLGPDTLRDIMGRKSFRGFKDISFTIHLGALTKTSTMGNLEIHLESFWSCRVVMEDAPTTPRHTVDSRADAAANGW